MIGNDEPSQQCNHCGQDLNGGPRVGGGLVEEGEGGGDGRLDQGGMLQETRMTGGAARGFHDDPVLQGKGKESQAKDL